MATKHSFAPKITAAEYLWLRNFSTDQWTESQYPTTRQLAGRGLLVCRYAYNEFMGFDIATNNYRLSKRGELMCRRYEQAQKPRDWKPNANKGMWGNAR